MHDLDFISYTVEKPKLNLNCSRFAAVTSVSIREKNRCSVCFLLGVFLYPVSHQSNVLFRRFMT